MSITHETPRDLRKKLNRATASHKALKNKYREKQYELKKLNNCLSAMQRSRDTWRLHSKDLKEKLCNISRERDDLKTKTVTIELVDQKKTR